MRVIYQNEAKDTNDNWNDNNNDNDNDHLNNYDWPHEYDEAMANQKKAQRKRWASRD